MFKIALSALQKLCFSLQQRHYFFIYRTKNISFHVLLSIFVLIYIFFTKLKFQHSNKAALFLLKSSSFFFTKKWILQNYLFCKQVMEWLLKEASFILHTNFINGNYQIWKRAALISSIQRGFKSSLVFGNWKSMLRLYWATRLLLVKCYVNKMVKSPYSWVISPLTQPQVANQQQQKNVFWRSCCRLVLHWDFDFILVASGCANDVVKATWLNQMGYTLKKQNPNWIANR